MIGYKLDQGRAAQFAALLHRKARERLAEPPLRIDPKPPEQIKPGTRRIAPVPHGQKPRQQWART